MRFSYPEVIGNIKEIKAIYDINATQADKIDAAINTVSNNLYIDTADKTHIEKWERMLQLDVYDGDTLNDRRFRIKSKIVERLPYSYRSIVNKLNALCDPSGYTLTVDTDAQTVRCTVNLSNKGLLSDFEKILDDTIPMNMAVTVEILKNTYQRVSGFTHEELSKRTHQYISEEVLRHEQ